MHYRRLSLWLAACCGFTAIQLAHGQDQSDFFAPDYKQALASARQAGRPVFVEITEKRCGFCRLLEEQTLSDPAVRRVLAPYAHVQVWWDGDADQKAFANSLLKRTAFPTLVFLNKNGEPAYTTMGYKKPEPFIAECVKASDILGVDVPYDARTGSQGETATGTLMTKPISTASNKIVSSNHDITPRIWTAKNSSSDNAAIKMVTDFRLADTTAKANQSVSKLPYSPLTDACTEIKIGHYERGIAIANSILRSDAGNAQAHYVLAVAYVNTRKNALAAEQYRLVIKLQPNSSLARLAHQGLQKIGQ